MQVLKPGGHRLFEQDPETARYVAEMLVDLEQHGMDAVRKYSRQYAPEHLELHVADPACYFDRLTNYGSLFIGEETTVAYGDRSIGTNHILPTSRAAPLTGRCGWARPWGSAPARRWRRRRWLTACGIALERAGNCCTGGEQYYLVSAFAGCQCR